ncbi:Uncharacterised protein [uncultured Clostridium sp.]|nr:Uncharacterised protein [uncultured Clostridium sp.]
MSKLEVATSDEISEKIDLIDEVWIIFKKDLISFVQSIDKDVSIKNIIEIIESITVRLNLNSEQIKIINYLKDTFIQSLKEHDAKAIKIMDLTIKRLKEDYCNIK